MRALPHAGGIQPDVLTARQRRTGRRQALLDLTASVHGSERAVKIRDLSALGFLVQTDVPLEIDQQIELDLPHEGMRLARVVWSVDSLAGCTFVEPVSRAAVSAAILKGGHGRANGAVEREWEKILGPLDSTDFGVRPEEKYAPAVRLVVVAVGAVLCWLPIVALAWAILA